jgi:hypothetical protein
MKDEMGHHAADFLQHFFGENEERISQLTLIIYQATQNI